MDSLMDFFPLPVVVQIVARAVSKDPTLQRTEAWDKWALRKDVSGPLLAQADYEYYKMLIREAREWKG